MANDQGNVLIRFSDVVFTYDNGHAVLDEASFSVRENAKVTVMGQNGAGKSTIFKLITGALKPSRGGIHVRDGATIGIGLQVMPREYRDNTVAEFFAHAFAEKQYDLDRRIADVLATVNLAAPLTQRIHTFSGGQQARLLLAFALIQEPDILLLDEPTNNLDKEGIEHLTGFLMMYPKTVLVISHDADFLNTFSEGVLHLDARTGKVDQYVGNYFNVIEEIAARVERERMQNARMLKEIQDRKDKINFFANKGGKMRKLASKLRDQVEDAEANMVEIRRDDKTIRDFVIPAQEVSEALLTVTSITLMQNGTPIRKEHPLKLWKKQRLLISGPNGIGKTTLLHTLASENDPGITRGENVHVGYYRQDFSGLDYDKTVYASLEEVMEMPDNEKLRAVAAEFLLTANLLKQPVGALSEGQKGLLCFARFVLQKPALLILDEPTNHINFRHLPVIARALEAYTGGIILVSHAPDFVNQIIITERLDLGALQQRITA